MEQLRSSTRLKLLGVSLVALSGAALFAGGSVGRLDDPRFSTDMRLGGILRLAGVLLLLMAIVQIGSLIAGRKDGLASRVKRLHRR
jgi:hypothetical protein